jgi:hypothetical protein
MNRVIASTMCLAALDAASLAVAASDNPRHAAHRSFGALTDRPEPYCSS